MFPKLASAVLVPGPLHFRHIVKRDVVCSHRKRSDLALRSVEESNEGPRMNLLRIAAIAPLILALPATADIPVPTSISFDATNPTNKITLTWLAIPTKQYNVLTTTALGQPWQPLTNGLVAAANNLVRFGARADDAVRFYRIVK